MSVFYQPIFTQTLSGSTGAVTFNNIPQNFTDLRVVISYKDQTSYNGSYLYSTINGSTANIYSGTALFQSITDYGTYLEATTSNSTNPYYITRLATANTSYWGANVFNSIIINFYNYSSSTLYKNFEFFVNAANNSTNNYGFNTASLLWKSTSPITQLSWSPSSGNFAQYATFSLYGTIRQGI